MELSRSQAIQDRALAFAASIERGIVDRDPRPEYKIEHFPLKKDTAATRLILPEIPDQAYFLQGVDIYGDRKICVARPGRIVVYGESDQVHQEVRGMLDKAEEVDHDKVATLSDLNMNTRPEAPNNLIRIEDAMFAEVERAFGLNYEPYFKRARVDEFSPTASREILSASQGAMGLSFVTGVISLFAASLAWSDLRFFAGHTPSDVIAGTVILSAAVFALSNLSCWIAAKYERSNLVKQILRQFDR